MIPEGFQLGFAFTAGAATFFAPCAYPMLPGYVAYFLGSDADRSVALSRAILVGTVASAGVFLVYVGLVGIVATIGSEALSTLPLFGLGVGVLLVVLGAGMLANVGTAQLLGGSPIIRLPERRRSLGGYFAFGVAYAIAAAGCTAPLFVGVVLSGLDRGGPAAVTTVAVYAAGMCALLVATTVATALGRGTALERVVPRGDRLKRVAGGLLVVAGIAQTYLYLFRFGGLELLGVG